VKADIEHTFSAPQGNAALHERGMTGRSRLRNLGAILPPKTPRSATAYYMNAKTFSLINKLCGL